MSDTETRPTEEKLPRVTSAHTRCAHGGVILCDDSASWRTGLRVALSMRKKDSRVGRYAAPPPSLTSTRQAHRRKHPSALLEYGSIR